MTDTLFTLSGFDITLSDVLLCLFIIGLTIWAYLKFSAYQFYNSDTYGFDPALHQGYKVRLAFSLLFLSATFILRVLRFDFVLLDFNEFSIFLSHLLEILSLFSIALLIDWLISHLFIKRRFKNREKPKSASTKSKGIGEQKATRLVRYIVYLYLVQILIRRLDLDFILLQREIKDELFTVHISDLIIAIMIMMSAKIFVWFFTQVTLYRMYKSKNMDEGTQIAINQLVTYLIYIIAILFALNRLVSDMRIIYGASAALLVGMGMGLKQTFNDFLSGLIILFERSIKVGDILEFEGQMGKILDIGLRASRIKTEKGVTVLIPNSLLVNQPVTNWSHFNELVRFNVTIAVQQQSDPEIVTSLMLQAAKDIPEIKSQPAPWVLFNEINENNLVFSLYFYSDKVLTARETQSKVRLKILHALNENGISLSSRVSSN